VSKIKYMETTKAICVGQFSTAVIIPFMICEELRIMPGKKIRIYLEDGRAVIEPINSE